MSQRLTSFDGNMTVARGTTYDLRDAWDQFLQFYWNLIEHNLGMIVFCLVVGLVLVLVVAAARRGVTGAARGGGGAGHRRDPGGDAAAGAEPGQGKAQRISAVNNLKQVGLAARTWAMDNGDVLPPSFEAMKNELSTDKITY